jgi:hypothetical protein
MSSGFSGRGKRVPRATAPAVDAAGRGSAASADSACGRSGCAYPTMRGAAGRRTAPGAGAFDSAKGARAMHATRDGRSRVRHGPIGRLASSRTGHEAIGSEDATAGVCALGVRDLHAFSLHRVRTVLTAAPPTRQRSAELFPLKLFALHTKNGVNEAWCFVGYEDGLHNAAMRCECADACGQHFHHEDSAAAQLHQGSACFLWFSNSRNTMTDAIFRRPQMRSEHVAPRTSQRQAPRMT